MAYFDNAATTYPKPECVYNFMDEFYRSNGGSAGRGYYEKAMSAGKLIEDTRVKLQEVLHCPAKTVVFQPTATISLNVVIQGLIQKGVKNIYITPFEHNAVTRVLYHFEKSGLINVQQLYVDQRLQYDLEKIRYQFDSCRPELVIVSHASNVTGLIAPIEEIFYLAKMYGAFTVADLSQTAGLIDIQVGLESFDFAVFAGHKTLYGPTGISGFVMRDDIDIPPLFFGGTGFESANQDMPSSLPQKYECGTLNMSGIAGLNAALGWIQTLGIKAIREVEQEHRERLIEIISRYRFLKIIGNTSKDRHVGIVSCVLDGISSDEANGLFSKEGIAVRTGLQCAPLAHRFLGTFPAGTVRFSVSYFTSDEDFVQLENALEYIEESY